jgi:putative transposase
LVAEEWVRRTAITKVDVSDEQRELLEETIYEWQRGCQIATDLAWENCHTKRDVQSLAYDVLRERTALHSQHATLATHQAAEALSGCKEQRDAGDAPSKPVFTAPSIVYDSRTMTVFEDGSISLATIGDRVRCSLSLPESPDGYQYRYLDSPHWEIAESTLHLRDGAVYLHLGFRRRPRDAEIATPEDGTVLGVDLGIENLAVTSTGTFVSGSALAHRLREFERTRAELQRTGTRSAHRTITSTTRREHRHLRDVLHRASKIVVEEALRYDCAFIALEDLTDIRTRTAASWGHRWAYRTLSEFIKYKATSAGISVVTVGATDTSKECADCGAVADCNRVSRNTFHCQECGREANADYNAAKNIGLRHVRQGPQSPGRTGNRQLALKSGTVTPNRDFTAYPEGFEAEFTDKSDQLRQIQPSD